MTTEGITRWSKCQRTAEH